MGRKNLKTWLCLLMAASSVSAAEETEVVKGVVRLRTRPSLTEVAEAYEKSSDISVRNVVYEMEKRQRDYGIGRIMTPRNAVVELQTLPDFKVDAKTAVDESGRYSFRVKEGSGYQRVYCKVELEEFEKKVSFIGSAKVWWNTKKQVYEQDIDLTRDSTSLLGRCVDKDGRPIADAFVQVKLVTAPPRREELYNTDMPWYIAITDSGGWWRVDGIRAPSYDRMIAYFCDTNRLHFCDDSMPPFKIKIGARHRFLPSVDEASVTIQNVTADNRAAFQKIIAACERKTGKKVPMHSPLKDFPVSTNNVIYVPDMVLPDAGATPLATMKAALIERVRAK